MQTIGLLLFDGFEEIEAITPLDLLRRVGFSVNTIACNSAQEIKGGQGLVIKADLLLSDAQDKIFDGLVIPGGPGVFKLRENTEVLGFIKKHFGLNKEIAAICAAPILLFDLGVLQERHYTHHFGVKELQNPYSNQDVVIDQNLITAQGPGTALNFALTLVKKWKDAPSAEILKKQICYCTNSKDC